MTCACLGPVKPEGDVCRRLQHENPRVRVDAAIEAGNTKDAAAVPFLIDRLTDQESSVRMFSAIALRKITGQDFGCVPWAGRDEQEEAVKKWRAWQRKSSNE
jgi:hypothetical protein